MMIRPGDLVEVMNKHSTYSAETPVGVVIRVVRIVQVEDVPTLYFSEGHPQDVFKARADNCRKI